MSLPVTRLPHRCGCARRHRMAVAGVGPAGRGHGRAPLCRRLHGLGQRRRGRLQGGHWSATALFATSAQLTISQAKSGAFANSLLVRAGIEEDGPSVPILTSFKDLGILQHACKVSAAATAARAQRTFGRFERLAGLPLPLHRRVQAVAAAGVAAAAYGAIAGTPPPYTGGVAAAAYGAIAGAIVGGRCLSGSKTLKASMSSAVPPTRGPPLAPRQHREHLVAQRL